MITEIEDCITNLQQENERLTQGVTLLTNKLIDMTKEKEDYKSRCEKTNKFIDNNTHYYSTTKHGEGFSIDLDEEVFCNTLSNILNGGENNDN